MQRKKMGKCYYANQKNRGTLKSASMISSRTIHSRVSSLHLKKYCQLAENCVCWPAAVISAERHLHHRPRSNDSPRCLQRWSPGRGRELMDPSFHPPEWIKSDSCQRCVKAGKEETVHFYSGGLFLEGFFWG